MSFFLLIVWQVMFVLRPLEWPMFGLNIEQPVTALIVLVSTALLLLFNRNVKLGSQFWVFTGFVVVILVSATLNGWLGGGVARVQAFVLTGFLPFILYSNHTISEAKMKVVIFLLLSFSVLMVSNGLSQLSAPEGIGWAGSRLVQDTRITFLGLLEDPNDLGGYFIMCIPFAAYFMRHGKLSMIKLFAFAMLIVLTYGIYLTNSRGTLVSAIALLAVYVFYRYGTGKAVFVGLALIPVLAVVLTQFRAIELESSAAERTDTWYVGLQLLEQNPLFGVGMGNFMDYNPITAHNSYVLVMSELGIIGYLLWLGLIVTSLIMSGKLLMHYRSKLMANGFRRLEPTELNSALALNAAIFFAFIGYLFSAFFLSRSYSAFLFMLCALATASYMRTTSLDLSLKLDAKQSLVRYTFAGSLFSVAGMYLVVRVLL